MIDFKTLDWKNVFFTFHGRVDQRVFIAYIILSCIVSLVFYVLAFVLPSSITLLLNLIVNIPLLWAGIAICIKRFHDMGKSGWLTLLYLIPIVGFGVLIWQGITKSEGPNAYGAQPVTI